MLQFRAAAKCEHMCHCYLSNCGSNQSLRWHRFFEFLLQVLACFVWLSTKLLIQRSLDFSHFVSVKKPNMIIWLLSSVEKQLQNMNVQGYIYQKGNTAHVEEVKFFFWFFLKYFRRSIGWFNKHDLASNCMFKVNNKDTLTSLYLTCSICSM